MDGDAFLEDLEEEYRTELSRLSSSKALYAVTGGEMDGPQIRAAVGQEAGSAAELFASWADDGEGAAAELFADVAADIDDHRERIGDGGGDPDTDGLLFDTLADYDTPPERVAGLLARTVVADRLTEQVVGYFVGDADPQAANEFRAIREELGDQRDRALSVLETVCDEEGWDEARDAAGAAIEGAYDYYVETLESMGVKPKNVC